MAWDGERGCYLKVVSTVACPVGLRNEEASIHLAVQDDGTATKQVITLQLLFIFAKNPLTCRFSCDSQTGLIGSLADKRRQDPPAHHLRGHPQRLWARCDEWLPLLIDLKETHGIAK